MGNNGEKPMKVGKLITFTRKMKKMVHFSWWSTDESSTEVSFPPPRAVLCDELFCSSDKGEGCQKEDIEDPVVAAMIAAQYHFTLGPNLLI